MAVSRCGICGSDLHWYREGHAPTVCVGHEIVGTVLAGTPEAPQYRQGSRVTIEAVRSCGACTYCRQGARQLCQSMGILGIDREGGFAETLDVLPSQLHTVPESIPDDIACFAEPLAVAVHAVALGPSPETKKVLVIGAGTLGLLTAFHLQEAGAGQVDLTAKRPHQVRAAHGLGIQNVCAPGQAAPAAYDLVFETVGGGPSTLQEALAVVAPGGSVILLGIFEKPPLLPALALLAKEVRVIGSMCYGTTKGVADFQKAHAILDRDGATIRDQLLTHTFPLEEIGAAFAAALDKSSGSIKVQVEVNALPQP